MSEGYRDDGGKPQFSLLPSDALTGAAQVLTWACNRTEPKPYPPRNWERGMAWSRCLDSMQRHTWSWWSGQDKDPQSGLYHADHIVVNALFLAAYSRRPHLAHLDDRPRAPAAGIVDPLKDCVSCAGTKGYHRIGCTIFEIRLKEK